MNRARTTTIQALGVPALLTTDEVAATLRTSRKAIYAMVARQQLPGDRACRSTRPGPRGRSGRLAPPEVHAVAGKVDSDERNSQTDTSEAGGTWTSASCCRTVSRIGSVSEFSTSSKSAAQAMGRGA